MGCCLSRACKRVASEDGWWWWQLCYCVGKNGCNVACNLDARCSMCLQILKYSPCSAMISCILCRPCSAWLVTLSPNMTILKNPFRSSVVYFLPEWVSMSKSQIWTGWVPASVRASWACSRVCWPSPAVHRLKLYMLPVPNYRPTYCILHWQHIHIDLSAKVLQW